MNSKFIITFPYESQDEFEEHQKRIFTKLFNDLIIPKDQKQKYLSRKEVAKRLQISLVTLNSWCKQGIVPSFRIGNRVLFKESDIELALKKVET